MTKKHKHMSKRITLRKKYSVDKKVKEHHRKIKKEAKKLGKIGFTPKRSKIAPGIPNLFPFKEQMLDQMERKMNMDKEMEQQLKELRNASRTLPSGSLENYAAEVSAKVERFEEENKRGGLTEQEIRDATNLMIKSGEINDPEARKMAQSRRAYYKELRKVVEASDVLIEVLDARDPEGCRNKEIEDQCVKEGKKVVLLVNKIDLVPPQNARMWQRYLRREFPTILFKATTQTQSQNIATGATLHKKSLMQNADMVEKMTSQSLAVGAENLLNVLKNYARVKGHGSAKQLITVGVVGFPNVGKSSVINSMKRSKAAVVGNMPGVTKKMQEISLDKNIVLIDSPGVVLSTNDQSDSLILRQAIKVEELTDPVRPVEALLNRIENEQLLKFYRIGQFTTAEQFLAQVAKKKGLLQTGGVPNIDETARCVIRDYLNGKLTYFTTPPQIDGDDDGDDAEMEEGQDEAMEYSDD